ncbi:hypothetical protein LWF01_06120 [Saxibacter everestensis]|uniref:DUF308 domain-containing protein n=1 Tax=Saxibacter everestensis TaxID=2909229 RepID=A0ABY8QX07_9MICO|nr:hypothetical protein LWF01_06120 [Brevibacteriaceae bacterium ZFBP1038]
MTERPRRREETVVGMRPVEMAVLWGGLPMAGALLGWFVTWLLRKLATVSWIPLPGAAEMALSVLDNVPFAQVGAIVLGVIAGLVLAFISAGEHVVVRVGPERFSVGREDDLQDIPRSAVQIVFIDGKSLVAQDAAGREFVRERGDFDPARLRDAFTDNGYMWAPTDPHAAEFKRWVPDMPGLPTGANALLQARSHAAEKKDSADVRELNAELAKLGVVVRDQNKGQYWRPVSGPCIHSGDA